MNLEHKNFGTIGSQTITSQDKDFYIEELPNGRAFIYQNHFYIVSADSKKNGSRFCISIKNGCGRWFDPNTIIKAISLYFIDQENTINKIYEENNSE